MSIIDGIRHRIRVWRNPRAYDREMREEHEFHRSLDAMQREHSARGSLSGADAAYAAQRRFGNATALREETREMAGLGFMELLVQDIRFGLRSFMRTPGFTIIAALTLAIGIGANTAIFSAIDALLLRPLPFLEPDRLMKISITRPARPESPANDDMVWSHPKFVVFRQNQRAFSDVSLYSDAQFTVRAGGEVERLTAEVTDAKYFSILGVRPTLGRSFFAEEDSVAGGPKVVTLSHNYWTRHFNADPQILGKTIGIGADQYTVVGVWPEGFRGLTGNVDLWIPLVQYDPEAPKEAWGHAFTQIGRIKPGITVAEAKAATVQAGATVDRVYPHPQFKSEHSSAIARELDTTRVDPLVRRSLLILLGSVVLVLLIGCANVASLFMERAAGRRAEIAVRLAIGASRARLIRQLVTESLLLSAIGGLLGVAIAWGGVRALASLNAARALNVRNLGGIGAVSFQNIELNLTALFVAALLTITTGLLFGVVPAWRSTRPSLSDDLKSGKLRTRAGLYRSFNGRSVLASIEIALALVLLAGSGLMLKSLSHLMGVSPGFNSEKLLTMRLNAPEGFSRDSMPGFYELVSQRLSGLPGVTAVTMQDCPPLNGGCNGTAAIRRDRAENSPDATAEVGVHWVSPNWPAAMGVKVVSGRSFESTDRQGTQKVVLISESAAKRLWPGEDPLGKPLNVLQGGFHKDTARIVGVVSDLRYNTLDALPQPDVYLSHLQSPRSGMLIMVRTAGDPLTVVASARAALRELAPDLPLYDVRTMADRIADSTAYARFGTILLVLFGIVALLLATLGTYGVIAFSVAQRTREIGIRVALGATTNQVVSMIVRHGLVIAGVGATAGLTIAFASTRVLQSILYEVHPTDGTTFVAIVGILVVAVVAASWIPARRAAGIEPTQALRQE